MAVRSGWTRMMLAAVALLAAASAQADTDKRVRYKWSDEQGNLHYADSIPTDAARLGYDVVSAQGVVIRHVERAKTAEELAAAKLARDKAAEAARLVEEAQRNDAQLLAAYPNEEDLRKSLQAQIEILNQKIQATEIGIQSQENSLAERLSHAADQERNGKPVPANVQQQIATLKQNLTDQKSFLQRRIVERDAAIKQRDVDLARYRELRERVDAQNRERAAH